MYCGIFRAGGIHYSRGRHHFIVGGNDAISIRFHPTIACTRCVLFFHHLVLLGKGTSSLSQARACVGSWWWRINVCRQYFNICIYRIHIMKTFFETPYIFILIWTSVAMLCVLFFSVFCFFLWILARACACESTIHPHWLIDWWGFFLLCSSGGGWWWHVTSFIQSWVLDPSVILTLSIVLIYQLCSLSITTSIGYIGHYTMNLAYGHGGTTTDGWWGRDLHLLDHF